MFIKVKQQNRASKQRTKKHVRSTKVKIEDRVYFHFFAWPTKWRLEHQSPNRRERLVRNRRDARRLYPDYSAQVSDWIRVDEASKRYSSARGPWFNSKYWTVIGNNISLAKRFQFILLLSGLPLLTASHMNCIRNRSKYAGDESPNW